MNIRQQPGTDSSVIGSFATGNTVSVIGETDNWFIVSVNGATGYVSKSYLTSDSSVASGNNGSTGGNTSGGKHLRRKYRRYHRRKHFRRRRACRLPDAQRHYYRFYCGYHHHCRG